MTASQTLRERLEALPRKVRVALESLLGAEQLSEEILTTLLDAADLAVDRAPLLGFAVGYQYLKAQGVPLDDVIRMARAEGRALNLRWSLRRWQDEHSRLSHAATLRRLAAANVRYDMAHYQSHLPARFKGYLILSSRRLAMEGFRQRHCIASYHELLAAKVCAIAVVFINRRRWTVQLTRTTDVQQPVCITAIHTRCNVRPSPTERALIHAMLGIVMESTPSTSMPAQRCYLENLRRILPLLCERNVHSVIVSFDGSGDDGSICDVTFEPELSEDPLVEVESTHVEMDTGTGRWTPKRQLDRITLTAAVEGLTYDYLEETGVNWYDNDGGYGELTIDVDEGTVHLQVHTRWTETSLEVDQGRSIVTGETL